MGIFIEDGSGRGYITHVDDSGRMHVEAITFTVEHHINHKFGRAYNAVFDATSAASADNCVFYLKNTSSEYDIVIEGIWMYVSQACEVYAYINVTGTPGGSLTTVTPTNLNAKSGRIAEVTCYSSDEITGLSNGDEIERMVHIAETMSHNYNFEQDVILGPNDTFALYAGTASTRVVGTLVFNFHNAE